jgi:hypothetical protein
MNIEIKAQWISALRSGAYKQGHHTLHSEDNCFCALGVLCDLYAKAFDLKWETHQTLMGSHSHFVTVYALQHRFSNGEMFYSVAVPQHPIASWAGTQANPWLHVTTKAGIRSEYHLSEINDNLELTFAQIADLIEEQL